MPDNVSFRDIPIDIVAPGQFIEIDNTKATAGLPTQDRRILLIGQKLAAGVGVANTLYLLEGPDHAGQLCGRGSIGHWQAVWMFKNNPYQEIWMIVADDLVAGVKATGSITVSGSPTEAGTLRLYVGGVAVSVGITAGQTTAVIATNIQTALAGNTDLEVDATVTTNTVTLTAKHKGEVGNEIDVRVNHYQGEKLPAGLTLAITAMTGGTGNPDVSPLLGTLTDRQFYTIVNPWTDAANLTALEDEMSSRWGPMKQRTGHIFSAKRGSYGTLVTFGTGRNSPHVSMLDSEAYPRSPYARAAMWAAKAELRGSADPARPFMGMVLEGDMPPKEAERRTFTQRDNLYKNGISSTTVDAGGQVLMEQVVTMYRKNMFNVTDRSYLKLQTKWTADYFRYAVRARIALRYPDYKLANDGTQFAPGQAIVTPSVIRSELLGLFKELEFVGLVEDYDQFKRDLIVVRSVANVNQVNAIMPPNFVNQFDIFAASVQFRM